MAAAVDETAGKVDAVAPGIKEEPARSGSSPALAWLALLLVIALAAGVAWVIRAGQEREAALAHRVAELEMQSRQKQSDLAELSSRWEQELNTGLAKLESSVESDTTRLTRDLDAAQATLADQQKELARFSASDRDNWLLAEAGHLLRLANQRLVMAGDPVAAQALLNSADAVLRELDDPTLHPVRAAIASDIASLREVPMVDVEGIYLRLAALTEQADKLVIFKMPERTAQPAPVTAGDWRSRLRQAYDAAVVKLSDYLVIRRRDEPMQALMAPQWEGLARQNLRLLLEQAQVALLSGNQTLYTTSLERARDWVAQFMESDENNARAISTQITQLAGLTINVPQPDISRSQRALDEAVAQRVQPVVGGE